MNIVDPLAFKRAVSSKGVPVYCKHIPWVDGWAAIRAVLRVGARHDPETKEGVAHLVEHSIFDGGGRLRSPAAVRKARNEIFADSLNALTDMEGTWVVGNALSQDFGRAIDVFSDLIFRPLLREETIAVGRQVVLREILSETPNERAADLDRLWCRDLYGGHPFSRIVKTAGWAKTVANITHEDIRRFHRFHYHLGNCSLIFVGDITTERALALADRFARGAPRGTPNPLPVGQGSWPKPVQAERDILRTRWFHRRKPYVENSELRVMRIIPKQRNPQTLAVLGGLLYDLLFQMVREKLGAGYRLGLHRYDYLDHHLCEVFLQIDQKAVDRIRQFIGEVFENFDQPRKYQERFRRVKSALIKGIELADYSVDAIARQAVSDFVNDGRITPVQEIRSQLSSVTYRDVSRLVAGEFSPDKLYWLIIRP